VPGHKERGKSQVLFMTTAKKRRVNEEEVTLKKSIGKLPFGLLIYQPPHD
jgi:hypothetical protein